MFAEDEIGRFYASIQGEIDHTPKQDTLIIIGVWNAKAGDKAESNVVRKFWLGVRKEAGDGLVDLL